MENTSPQVNAPTWSGSLSYGWETMKSNFLPLFLIVIVIIILDIPLQVLDEEKFDGFSLNVILQTLGLAYWLFFLPVILFSADWLFIQAVRREKLDLKQIVIGFGNYLNIVLTHLLVTALVGIALIALIIPGIIVGCRLAFVSFLVMDKGLDPIAAVETSWKMTRGYGWKIFFLGFTSIFIFILGLALLLVGVIPAVMWIKASFASLYQAVLEEQNGNGQVI